MEKTGISTMVIGITIQKIEAKNTDQYSKKNTTTIKIKSYKIIVTNCCLF